MPRYSVIVEITRDIVVNARSESAAKKKVEAILAGAQAWGDDNDRGAEPLYSMDTPTVCNVSEVADDYTSGSGDDPPASYTAPIKKGKR
jgi:hypothetical protein